jgi:alkylation response protein AidB-like acyl-CoA dehydrogenase
MTQKLITNYENGYPPVRDYQWWGGRLWPPESGGHGGLERLFRDAKAGQIYEGTNEIMRLIIARDLLKGE